MTAHLVSPHELHSLSSIHARAHDIVLNLLARLQVAECRLTVLGIQRHNQVVTELRRRAAVQLRKDQVDVSRKQAKSISKGGDPNSGSSQQELDTKVFMKPTMKQVHVCILNPACLTSTSE